MFDDIKRLIDAFSAMLPITRRRTYWTSGAVGSDVSLLWEGKKPREIRVHVGGTLIVRLDDGSKDTITDIPWGAVFVDSCWVGLQATGSTARSISVGW